MAAAASAVYGDTTKIGPKPIPKRHHKPALAAAIDAQCGYTLTAPKSGISTLCPGYWYRECTKVNALVFFHDNWFVCTNY